MQSRQSLKAASSNRFACEYGPEIHHTSYSNEIVGDMNRVCQSCHVFKLKLKHLKRVAFPEKLV